TDGRVLIDVMASYAIGEGMAIDRLGRVIVEGDLYDGFAVARFQSDGTLDTSFNGNGKAIFPSNSIIEHANWVTVDSLDRVIIAGYSYDGTKSEVFVARITATGELDTSFDGDGKVTFDFGDPYQEAWGVAVDSQDRVVVVGDAGGFQHGVVA